VADNRQPDQAGRSGDQGRGGRARTSGRGQTGEPRADRPAGGGKSRRPPSSGGRESGAGDRPEAAGRPDRTGRADPAERPARTDRPVRAGGHPDRPGPVKRSDRARGDRPTDWTPHTRGERGDRAQINRESPRPGLARKANEPPIPQGVDTRELARSVRAELRGLPKELAEIVASHLVVAGQLIDSDPDLAYAHAEAARRRAARLPIVREAAAETAYAAGHFDVALSEFRALRRMTGTHDYLPVMADCERALGRPLAALKLAKESHRYDLDPAQRIEMTIVEAGARADLGQHPEARRILKAAIDSFTPSGEDGRVPKARLRYAYADALLQAGSDDEARSWFVMAAQLDHEGETDAQVRADELDGLRIDFDIGSEEGHSLVDDQDEEVTPQ
jgi:hypothetical protein